MSNDKIVSLIKRVKFFKDYGMTRSKLIIFRNIIQLEFIPLSDFNCSIFFLNVLLLFRQEGLRLFKKVGKKLEGAVNFAVVIYCNFYCFTFKREFQKWLTLVTRNNCFFGCNNCFAFYMPL